MKFFYFIALIFALQSCDVEKRFQRLVIKNPSLIQKRDTTISFDTTIVQGVKHDTLFYPKQGKRDTFIIRTPRSITRIYMNENKSEVAAHTDIKTDTLISQNTIISSYIDTFEIRLKKTLRKWGIALAVALVGLGSFSYGLRYLTKTFKIKKQ